MANNKSRLELKVGLFVFIGLLIFALFILSIKSIKSLASTYSINMLFGFVNGVKVGAPVRLAGVDVGEVKDIEVYFDSNKKKMQVNVLAGVDKKIKVPFGSSVWINTLGLLGEKYVEIMPGSSDSEFYQAGETIVGIDPVAMHEVGVLLQDIATGLDEVVKQVHSGEGTMSKLIYDSGLYENLEEMTADLKNNPWKLLHKPKK